MQPFVLSHLELWADSGALQRQPRYGRCRCSCRCGRASGWRFSVSWWSQCCPQSHRGWLELVVHLSAKWCLVAGRLTWPRRGWRHVDRWWNAGTQRAECRGGLQTEGEGRRETWKERDTKTKCDFSLVFHRKFEFPGFCGRHCVLFSKCNPSIF